MDDQQLTEIETHAYQHSEADMTAWGDVMLLVAEIHRLQAMLNGHAIALATQRKMSQLEAEIERLRADNQALRAKLADVATALLTTANALRQAQRLVQSGG